MPRFSLTAILLMALAFALPPVIGDDGERILTIDHYDLCA
jgi:hypothetical protein